MARAARAKSVKQPMVREASVEYEANPPADVFWRAFKELSEENQGAFLRKLLEDAEWYEEIEDAISIIQARNEPSRPFEEFEDELKREGRL